jgi:hypothetical protein
MKIDSVLSRLPSAGDAAVNTLRLRASVATGQGVAVGDAERRQDVTSSQSFPGVYLLLRRPYNPAP